MKRRLSLDYTMGFSQGTVFNKKFEKVVVSVAYAGLNRNHSIIEKDVFERALPSMKNIPLVANYKISEDELGGHDLEIVTDKDGQLQVVNATVAFGVVPESATQWWETREDGREYLMTEALLWKRSPATKHVMEQKQVGQSMEILVEDNQWSVNKDNNIVIKDFEFDALCAIGVEPCFEAASIQLASERVLSSFRQQFALMLDDLKKFSLEEGGKADLMDNEQTVDIQEVTEYVVEEVAVEDAQEGVVFADGEETETETVAEETAVEETVAVEEETQTASDEATESTEEATTEEFTEKTFEVYYNTKRRALSNLFKDTYERNEQDEVVRATEYWLIDFTDSYVFVNIYTWNGEESASTDVRYPYVFDEQTLSASLTGSAEKVFPRYLTSEEIAKLESDAKAFADMSAEFTAYKENYTVSNEEVQKLINYKTEKEKEIRDAAVAEIFELFDEELGDMEEYQALRENNSTLTVTELEDKCFMLRGKKTFTRKTTKRSPKLRIEDTKPDVENPYGDLF